METRVPIAAAFERAITESKWLAWLQPFADPALRPSLKNVWEQSILPPIFSIMESGSLNLRNNREPVLRQLKESS